MAIVTLSELRTKAKERADMESSDFVSTDEWNRLINAGKRNLEDLLVRNYGEDYYAQSVSFLTTVNTENYSLSTLTSGTFYKALALSQQGSSGWMDVDSYTFKERNMLRTNAIQSNQNSKYRYRIIAGNLSILPTPPTGVRFELYFVPITIPFFNDNDSYDDINGWSDLIVLDAAIMALNKEESDVSALQIERGRVEQRIIASAPNRDAFNPQTVADVQEVPPGLLGYWWPRRNW